MNEHERDAQPLRKHAHGWFKTNVHKHASCTSAMKKAKVRKSKKPIQMEDKAVLRALRTVMKKVHHIYS